MLSKNFYRAIANIILETEEQGYKPMVAALKLATYFQENDPEFNIASFMDAAGFEHIRFESGQCEWTYMGRKETRSEHRQHLIEEYSKFK